MAATMSATRTTAMTAKAPSRFWQPWVVFPLAIAFRVVLLAYGRWQDQHSPMKYTDIDYLVFTDAARFVSQQKSPYDRATYRYTPLLAWLLLPTTWTAGGAWWFEFGKALFAAGDIVTGWLIFRILRDHHAGMSADRALRFASIWLLNPMVANISTRGSSEGLLAVLVVALLWAALARRVVLAGALLGFAVHLKIYPFIYAASIFCWLGESYSRCRTGTHGKGGSWLVATLRNLLSRERVTLAATSFVTFMGLNLVMYHAYGMPFLEHSYTYHLTRSDHRHNFSVYNTLLHLGSLQTATADAAAQASSSSSSVLGLRVEAVAFVPQLSLAIIAFPLLLAKKDLASTMLAQTFAFVTFNKVCTSQYFLWYMVFLPFYLPTSTLLREKVTGSVALLLWVLGQALWLQQGYELEFLGRATFAPGLWLAGLTFFLVNCWILGIVVNDIACSSRGESRTPVAVAVEKQIAVESTSSPAQTARPAAVPARGRSQMPL